MVAYFIVLFLLFGVLYLITDPFRRRAFAEAVGEEVVDDARPPELIELEAARDAKYREIRDAELDHQTGKLSEDDFAAIDSTLRSEAVVLLRKLDEFHAGRGGARESAAVGDGELAKPEATASLSASDKHAPSTPTAPRDGSSSEGAD